MDDVLKITNVLGDQTRYSIYDYLVQHKSEVGVQDIADKFHIHPNVARLHLTKLEDIHLIQSYLSKTGKGGRPSRKYKISDISIQLSFPFRDYQLLAKIAIESMASLGEVGKQALYATGKKFGHEIAQKYFYSQGTLPVSLDRKIDIIKEIATSCGLYADFHVRKEDGSVNLAINNCPFKELVDTEVHSICHMHLAFLQGIFEEVLDGVTLQEINNMTEGCTQCTYQAFLPN